MKRFAVTYSNGDPTTLSRCLHIDSRTAIKNRFSENGGKKLHISNEEIYNIRSTLMAQSRRYGTRDSRIYMSGMFFICLGVFTIILMSGSIITINMTGSGSSKTIFYVVDGISAVLAAAGVFLALRGRVGRRFFENAEISSYEFTVTDKVKIDNEFRDEYSIYRSSYVLRFGENFVKVDRNTYETAKIGGKLYCITAIYKKEIFFEISSII